MTLRDQRNIPPPPAIRFTLELRPQASPLTVEVLLWLERRSEAIGHLHVPTSELGDVVGAMLRAWLAGAPMTGPG